MKEQEKDALLVYLDWHLKNLHNEFKQFIICPEELEEAFCELLLDLEVTLTHNNDYIEKVGKSEVDKPQ